MRRFNLFSGLYLATAVAFAAIGVARNYYDAYAAAGLALTCAVCSMFPWWRRVIVNTGRRNSLIFDLVSIVIALAIQIYGLISGRFGVIYFIVGFIIATSISMLEDHAVLNEAEKPKATDV